jgi:tetratricopeptide (TPR) repeat protein
VAAPPPPNNTFDRKDDVSMLSAKVPAGLFIAAGLIAGVGLLTQDDSDAVEALPDPAVMVANAYGYEPLEDVVALWQGRVDANSADQLSRIRLGSSLVGLAAETGDAELYEQAEGEFRIAVEASPGSVEARVGLAGALRAQHEFVAALEVLEELADDRPGNLDLQVAIADVQLDLGNYPEAFAGFGVLASEAPGSPAALSRQARQASLTDDADRAIQLARTSLIASAALDLRPADAAAAWFQLAYFQYLAGQVDDAEAAVRSGLTIDGDHQPSRELLGEVLVAQGDLDEAAAWYEELVRSTPAADLHGLLAEIYQAQGRLMDADEQLELGRAMLAEQLGRFPAEQRHMAEFAAAVDPALFLELMEHDLEARRDVEGLDLLAWAYYLNGDIDDATATIDAAMALGTRNAPLLFHAGMIAAAAGDTDTAKRHLNDALSINAGFDLGDAALARQTLADL